nr:glycosyltransferase [Actinomycetota bacterium]
SRSSVAVCPMINGTGIRNKLLEAMANSLPCVTTPLALQGIDAEPGRHLLVASDALGISEKVVQVLRDQKYAREVGRAGHDFVRIHHNWDIVVQSYERIYAEAVSESTRNQATAESSLPKPAETDPDSQENL